MNEILHFSLLSIGKTKETKKEMKQKTLSFIKLNQTFLNN